MAIDDHEPLFDREALLAPIESEDPCGPRFPETAQSGRDGVRIVRAEAARIEEKLKGETTADGLDKLPTVAMAQWEQVLANASDHLRHECKDIEVACWLAEAAIRCGRFRGLEAGLTVIADLIERYGTELHPRPEPGEAEMRHDYVIDIDVPLNALLLQHCPLASPDDPEEPSLTLRRVVNSRAGDPGEMSESEAAFAARLTRAIVSAGAEERMRSLLQSVEAGMVASRRVSELVAERFGAQVTLSRFVQVLEVARSVLSDALGDAPGSASEGELGGPAESAGAVTASATRAKAWDRQRFLDELESKADEFARHEHQSLLPLEIRNAVRRARLPTMEFFNEAYEKRDYLFKEFGIGEKNSG